MSKITIFTDGACSGNPGLGGYAFVMKATLIPKGEKVERTFEFKGSGNAAATTNNKMELTAALMALRALKTEGNEITFVGDSKYVLDGIGGSLAKWKANGWRKADNKPLKNIEMWQSLDQLLSKQVLVGVTWVKGHAGHPENELCDSMAQDEIRKAMEA